MFRRVLSGVIGISIVVALAASAQAQFSGSFSNPIQWVDGVQTVDFNSASLMLEASVAWNVSAAIQGGEYDYQIIVHWRDGNNNPINGTTTTITGMLHDHSPQNRLASATYTSISRPPDGWPFSNYWCWFEMRYKLTSSSTWIEDDGSPVILHFS
jgi:hypothetical protein